MIRQRAARSKEFDLSNKQIETLLARSSRAMRKHWYNRGSIVLYGPVVKNNLTTDGDVRFAVDKIDNLDIKQAFPRYTSSQAADVLITQKISSDKGTNRIYSLEVDEIVPEIKIRSEMHPDFGSQSSGQSLVHRNYPDDVINKLQAKYEKIKSFLSENLKKIIGGSRSSENSVLSDWMENSGRTI